jgi:hypothetical protein
VGISLTIARLGLEVWPPAWLSSVEDQVEPPRHRLAEWDRAGLAQFSGLDGRSDLRTQIIG